MKKIKRPEKILHNHNSIPNYIDEVEEGCGICGINQAIIDYEAYLESLLGGLKEIYDEPCMIFDENSAEKMSDAIQEIAKERGW